MTLGSIRRKLFVLITCCVAVPVAVLATFFPATRIVALEDALTTKASSFARMLVHETESAIAFDDGETAREIFEGVTNDEDVAFVALFRADGSLLQAIGASEAPPPPWTDTVTISRPPGRVRVVAPVITHEGPRGLLVVELSTAGALAEAARSRRMGWLMGSGSLLFACFAAWLVGTSLGRRLERVHAEAARVAGGDLSDRPLSDGAGDEIGQLARAFQTMVQGLKRAYAGIEQEVQDRTEALATSREQFRALIETTDAVPWEMQVGSWRFTYVGPQAALLFGIPQEAWGEAARWQSYIPGEDLARVLAAFEGVMADRIEQAVEVPIQRELRRTLWIRILISAVPADPVTTLRGFMFDVTERAQLEVELRQAQKLESVGRLASGIAHEINTPIQFVSDSVHFVSTAFGEINGLIERYRALREGPGDADRTAAFAEIENAEADIDLPYLTDNVPKALDRAIDGLGRVATIVRSMKEFAHPDQREKSSADINNALANALLMARHEYKEVADVETDFGPIPPVWCQIGELNQAFLNIVVNAGHAIADVVKDRGGRGLIRVVTRQEGPYVVVEISDTGGGIPEAIRAQIFDPFFTTKEVGRGTGQGLAIARRAVRERHGGSLTFASTMGKGTTFVIKLAIEGVGQPTVSADPVDPEAGNPEAGNPEAAEAGPAQQDLKPATPTDDTVMNLTELHREIRPLR